VVPAAWEAKDVALWRTLLLARAYENDVFVAAANRIGEEPSYTFAGESAVLAPAARSWLRWRSRKRDTSLCAWTWMRSAAP
jgi:predicted amidohydrolase